ncbi:hypothetical protein [Vitiosangium sp. GDMCC 1.1324]|uniref:hypothetical protein n=1 Tax=Vitiosangium sp. (strain GDMCC 1.1324) TaxID=2138576 RepID=UPI000D3BA007|nr:hypothetical protein [Vitiosangium sp. GDMCC 1.1324]PTL84216.1 hypothetical protein DAT35_12350 [Vitiosangium sp. GDMCC 1.1324]
MSTFGFSGVGRLVAIAMEALEDLSTQLPLQKLGREVGVFVALPDFSNGSGPREVAATTRDLGCQVLGRALEGLGLSWPEDRWRFFTGGSAGFALALQAARQELERRALETCIVGGLDSRADPEHLRFLLSERRLKTADNPVGLMPGEAGALLVLRLRGQGRGAEVTPAVELTDVHIEHEPAHVGTSLHANGVTLSTCIQAAIGSAPLGSRELVFVSDLNGEERRGREWGNALVRLKGGGALREAVREWIPATGFGDVGAAAGAVGTCIAVRAFQRRYARAQRIIVVSQSDSGERAAFAAVAHDVPARGGRT